VLTVTMATCSAMAYYALHLAAVWLFKAGGAELARRLDILQNNAGWNWRNRNMRTMRGVKLTTECFPSVCSYFVLVYVMLNLK
jgi:hypothetical protein